MSTEQEYRVIGTRPIRHDGADKVTGRAIFGGDVEAVAEVGEILMAHQVVDRACAEYEPDLGLGFRRSQFI